MKQLSHNSCQLSATLFSGLTSKQDTEELKHEHYTSEPTTASNLDTIVPLAIDVHFSHHQVQHVCTQLLPVRYYANNVIQRAESLCPNL